MTRVIVVVLALTTATLAGPKIRTSEGRAAATIAAKKHPLFKTSDDCLACHNGLTTPSGEDVSIGSSWRASMMANSSRDPYWQASVRRETIDHPSAAADIQDECSICHMPMSRAEARANGRRGEVFAHLPIGRGARTEDLLAFDGVSCTACHQIAADKLGTPGSFTGGFVIQPRTVFGPFPVDAGLKSVMHSSSEAEPAEGPHIRESALCGTCHTLITTARGPETQAAGQVHEQVMYLEWRHSAFNAEQKSCQSCHMPPVQDEMPISSVLGQPRKGLARHLFVGGNAFMLRLLNRFRDELGVAASREELDASVARTVENLQGSTATVAVDRVALSNGQLAVDVTVQNATGHKFPTGYPSRRAWLHVTVTDRAGRVVFESGAFARNGRIEGNDNDAAADRFEPHYTDIRRADEVQIYESIMGDSAGKATTGLLTGVRYLKDNRLLPRGFDKGSADVPIAVSGDAMRDPDFTAGSDKVRYVVGVVQSDAPFHVTVELRFQAIGFRWAENLAAYDAPEPRRFVRYYEAMAASSSELVSRASTDAQ